MVKAERDEGVDRAQATRNFLLYHPHIISYPPAYCILISLLNWKEKRGRKYYCWYMEEVAVVLVLLEAEYVAGGGSSSWVIVLSVAVVVEALGNVVAVVVAWWCNVKVDVDDSSDR